jgi:glutathione synthase/RimK-type ligase-like ATP-grasp enzyme
VSPRIGIAVGAANPRLSASDRHFADALMGLGCAVVVVSWNQCAIDDLSTCDAIVLRATWDYQDDPCGFNRWTGQIEEAGIRLFNSATLTAWNNDKRHIIELFDAGLPVPPTLDMARWQGPVSTAADMLDGDVVLKPAWGGDGIGVYRATSCSAESVIAQIHAKLPGRPLLMQPYLPQIRDGEWSLIFVAGEFCHAVLKLPAAEDFRANGRFGATRRLATPPKVAIDTAAQVLSFVGSTPLYARVDGVMADNSFMCTELELTDPNLCLDLAPQTAARLAAETVRLTKGACRASIDPPHRTEPASNLLPAEAHFEPLPRPAGDR